MPLNVEALSSQVSKTLATSSIKQYVPRFFNTNQVQLTGKGKATGLLREERNPVHTSPSVTTDYQNVDPYRHHMQAQDYEYTFIPLFVISSRNESLVRSRKLLPTYRSCDFGRDAYGNRKFRLRVSAHSLTASRQNKSYDVNGKVITYPTNILPCYQVSVAAIVDDTNDQMANISATESNPSVGDLTYVKKNAYFNIYTCNVPQTLKDICTELEHTGAVVDRPALNVYLSSLDLYTMICERSEIWQETLDEEIRPLFDAAVLMGSTMSSTYLGAIRDVLHRLESYAVPLDIYRNIYQDLQARFVVDDVKRLCKENLNLMLSDLMETLRADQGKLEKFTCDPNVTIDSIYSKEQRALIKNEAPLALVQAVAGAGKSYTILGRIQYMIDCGVKPEDINVISFTNAAADHIHEMNPDIHSMTIDSLITRIYQFNYPNQEISTNHTLMNCLDVYFPRDSVAMELRRHINNVSVTMEGAMTRLNLFVEQNLDRIVEMLEEIQQVTLDLAIVICYQQIDKLVQPDDIASKHLIVDEVQDTSIFQFIYALKYIHKHNESLLLVGDSSQTLYEFRFANPRALNVMESSGVFTTYKLERNYRSCQEILDMANNILGNIEANQFAKLRLTSDDLTPVTAKSFQEKVQLQYVRTKSNKELTDNMDNFVRIYLKPYIDACHARGEQVMMLAYRSEHVRAMERAVRVLYPNFKIVNTSPQKPFDQTILTSFAKSYWNDVQFLPKSNLVTNVKLLMMSNLSKLVAKPSMKGVAAAFIDEWATQAKPYIDPMYQQYIYGAITADDMLSALQRNMFSFEAKKNIAAQNLRSRQNQAMRNPEENKDADILLSTIHSAKGLEWDNVVVLYQDKNPMAEDLKRMYYVAMTRATKSEFILAYESAASSIIKATYDAQVSKLVATSVDV